MLGLAGSGTGEGLEKVEVTVCSGRCLDNVRHVGAR